MYPTFEKIREMATGDYKRIPICKELYADSYTPVEMMRILQKASHHCYLLESASQSEAWGRYSFLGYDPSMEITCTDGILRIRKNSKTETFGRSGNAAESSTESSTEEVRQVAHPGDAIREIISQYKSPVMDDMPTFTGGLVGYFSYDYIKYSEPKLELKDKEQQDFRDLDLMLFNDVIAFDHYRQKVLLITGVMTENLEKSYKQACKKLEEMTALIKKGEKKIFPPIRLKSEIKPQFPKEKYCQMVETAKHYIHEGDIFQVVLSNPMRAKAEGSLFDTYRVLRATNPSPYMFYFSSDDIEIAGASPETLVKLEHGKLSTFPLAGTRPRGKTPEEDKALEADLLQDEKELAEHNMLVDLGRNDIGKISELGSVKVEKYLTVERYSCVMHLGSTVTGTIKKGKDAIDAVDAILPAGTLSGAPKFRACQIIQELEQSKRGNDRADGRRSIVAHAGQRAHLPVRGREHPAEPRHDLPRGSMEVAGTAVIAQPLPQFEHLVLGRGCQCGDVGEPLRKAQVVLQSLRHARLLQDNLRKPYPVRVTRATPGQVTAFAGEPG